MSEQAQLSDEDIAQAKQAFKILRKAKEAKPVGFWYCQEAGDGLPRMLAARPGKKSVPRKQTALIKRTAKNKSRICEGVAFRDPDGSGVRFSVAKGKFNQNQFKKDMLKLGKAAGVRLGKVSIGLMEDKARAEVGQELVAELEAENRQSRARAEALEKMATTADGSVISSLAQVDEGKRIALLAAQLGLQPDEIDETRRLALEQIARDATADPKAALDQLKALSRDEHDRALSEIFELDERERAEYISGAGSKEYKHNQGRGARMMNFMRGRTSDDDIEPELLTADERWEFQEQLRAEFEDDRDEAKKLWEGLLAKVKEVSSARKKAIAAFDDVEKRVSSGVERAAEGSALAQEAAQASATVEAYDRNYYELAAAMKRTAEQLSDLLGSEIGYFGTRAVECPTHRDEARAWQAETEKELAALKPTFDKADRAEASAGPDLNDRVKRAREMLAQAEMLAWSPEEREADSLLQQKKAEAGAVLEAAEARVADQQKALGEIDGQQEALDRERRELIRSLRDEAKKLKGAFLGRSKKKHQARIDAMNIRLAELDAGLQKIAREKLAANKTLLDLRAEAGKQEDAAMRVDEEIASARADRVVAATQRADDDYSQLLEESGAKELETAYQDAQVSLAEAAKEVQTAGQDKRDAQNELSRLAAEIERLEDPLSGARDAPRAAHDVLLQASADLEAHKRYIEEVKADFPPLTEIDPVLAKRLEAKLREMEAKQEALEATLKEAQGSEQDAKIRAEAVGHRDAVRSAKKVAEQIESSGREVSDEVKALSEEIAGLESRAARDISEAEAKHIADRIETLSKKRKKARSSLKKLKSRRKAHAKTLGTLEETWRSFHDENAGLLDQESDPDALAEAREKVKAAQERADAADALLKDAPTRLKEAQESLSKARGEYQGAITDNPALKEALLHAEVLSEQQGEAAAVERLQEVHRLAAATRGDAQDIHQAALAAQKKAADAFESLRDAEDIFEAGKQDKDGSSMLIRLREADPDKYDMAIGAATTIINQIERLKKLGEPPESYLPLLEPIPKAFWPDRLVSESQDYAEIEALFVEEDAGKQDKLREQTLASMVNSGVDVTADVGLNIANLVLCDTDAISAMANLGDSAPNTVGAWQAVSILGAVAAAKPLVEQMLAKSYTMPEGVSDLEMRVLREELNRTGFEKLKAAGGDIANFLDATDFALAANNALLGGPLMSGTGVLVPGPGIVFGLINTACAINVAKKAADKSSGDSDLLETMKEEDADDPNLLRAMNNRSKRSKRLRNEAIIDAAVTGTNTVATVGNSVPGGQMVAVGAWAAAATMASIKAAWSAGVDWKQAAKAKDLVKKAKLGSRRAMMEIFDHHQKYASMLMLLRARDGNTQAVKFCSSRGLAEGELLDSKASLALLRKFMLQADGQSDDPGNTFTESAGKAWDTLCKGAKLMTRIKPIGDAVQAHKDKKKAQEQAESDAREVESRQITVNIAPAEAFFTSQDKLIGNALSQAERYGAPFDAPLKALSPLHAGLPSTRTQWTKLKGELEDTRDWRPSAWTEEQKRTLDALPGFLDRLSALETEMGRLIQELTAGEVPLRG